MPELLPNTAFALKLTEKELAVTMKAIGIAAGLPIRDFTDEERTIAKTINDTVLRHQVVIYRERLKHAEAKLQRSQGYNDHGYPLEDELDDDQTS